MAAVRLELIYKILDFVSESPVPDNISTPPDFPYDPQPDDLTKFWQAEDRRGRWGSKYAGIIGASESILADGRVVVPGEPIDLSSDDLKDEHNKRLIDEGQLVEMQSKEAKAK